MLRLFADNLLPVFLAAGTGFALAARGKVDPRPIARVGFFIFSPCLVFQAIVDSRLPTGDLLRMSLFSFTVLLALGAVALGIGRVMRWPRPLIAAVVLSALLPNAGNYGLSVNAFAFGDAGLAQASIFFVCAAIVSYTFGVLVASMGRASFGRAMIGLLGVPTIWAVPLALVMASQSWDLPFPVARTVKLLADATIPVFLVVLGMQLHSARLRGRFVPLATGAGLRLVGGAVLGLGLAAVFGLEGVARQAGVLEAAMPSAVIAIVLATEYDVEPAFVTSAVLVTTLLSPLTLTPLLQVLGK